MYCRHIVCNPQTPCKTKVLKFSGGCHFARPFVNKEWSRIIESVYISWQFGLLRFKQTTQTVQTSHCHAFIVISTWAWSSHEVKNVILQISSMLVCCSREFWTTISCAKESKDCIDCSLSCVDRKDNVKDSWQSCARKESCYQLPISKVTHKSKTLKFPNQGAHSHQHVSCHVEQHKKRAEPHVGNNRE